MVQRFRYNNDTAYGGGGADRFQLRNGYNLHGDHHTIGDINYAEGDWIQFANFDPARPWSIWIYNYADLQDLADEGFLTLTVM